MNKFLILGLLFMTVFSMGAINAHTFNVGDSIIVSHDSFAESIIFTDGSLEAPGIWQAIRYGNFNGKNSYIDYLDFLNKEVNPILHINQRHTDPEGRITYTAQVLRNFDWDFPYDELEQIE